MTLARSRSSAPTSSQQLEALEQAIVIEWAGYQSAPTGDRLARYLFSIPNGAYLAGSGPQRAAQMHRLKKTGLTPGVADLFLAIPVEPYHGYFIEMKRRRSDFESEARAKAAITDAQRQFGLLMLSAGYLWSVCFGAEEAIANIPAYLAGGLESPATQSSLGGCLP